MLDEELGLEPDDELQRLERAILNHDPSLESPVVAGVKRPSVAQRRRASSRTEAPVPPDSVAVIDLQRSRVVGHVLVGRRPVAVAIGHGSVWVANADDGTVSRIDPDRREVIRTIGIGAPAIDLAVATDAVWVANGSDGTVSRIDPSADAVVETIDLRGSSELVWNPTYAVDADDDSVWIAAGPHHVLRIDPATNEPSAIIDVGHVPVGVALGEEALWVVTTAERALRIEPHTNTATTEVPIGYPVALTAGKQAVWVSDSRGQVWRINPDTGTVTQTTPVGRGLVGLCATDGAVFAANNADGTVVQIDPQDGRVVGLVPVGHAPTDVASWDGTVWVSIQSESAQALCGDRARDRDLPGDDLGPDVLDLGLERARHRRADRAEADTAVPEGEAGSATGLERPARELLDRVEHGHVHPLHRARQYVPAEMGLVDIDSDPPDSTLSCRLQRPESAGAGDLEHDSRALRDLAQGDRPTFHGVEEVVGIAVQRRDARIGSSRACLVAGDEPLDRRHPLAADRADHLLPGRERQHERSQVAGQITGLLFAEHEAHDVLRAMRQIVVGDVDDREPRFGKPGGDSVDRGGRQRRFR